MYEGERRASDYSNHLSSYEDHESSEKTAIVEEELESAGGPPQPPTEIFKAQEITRTDTPNTYVLEVADKPDITMFCELCHIFIDIKTLRHHRAYHNALLLLGCKSHELPESTEMLLKKRAAILKKMKKDATAENPLLPAQIQKVNDAYELLKAEVEDTYEVCRKTKDTVDTTCRATALNSNAKCVYAMGMCSSPNSKWKSDMEDTKIYQDSFGENKDKCYIGLFDGYHGRFTAEVSASLLHKILLHELMKFDNTLSLHPTGVFDTETDISHHSFVFGSSAKLDGSLDGFEKIGKKEGKDRLLDGAVPVTIKPEDDELTKRIIELCEHKYGELLEDMSSHPSAAKSLRSQGNKIDKPRHPQEEAIRQAYIKSYQLLDILLSYGKDEWSRVRWSGCSALTALIESVPQPDKEENEAQPVGSVMNNIPGADGDNKVPTDNKTKKADPPQIRGYIHLANAGDVRAVLVRGNRPYRLSKDHTPLNPKERERILKMGGQLTNSEMDSRVNGVLATTRGLGNHGDLALKNCVLVEPHTCSVQLDQYAQFLVLATRGLWEILSDEEVAHLLLRQLPQNQIPAPSKPSSSLEGLLQSQVGSLEIGSLAIVMADVAGDNTMTGQLPTTTADEGIKEKGAGDAEISEKPSDAGQALRIAADLKTEAGSHDGDGDDHDHDLEGDKVTLPLHSNLQLDDKGSVEDRRRNLAKHMAEHLLQAALLAGSHDNITVIVVLLPGFEV